MISIPAAKNLTKSSGKMIAVFRHQMISISTKFLQKKVYKKLTVPQFEHYTLEKCTSVQPPEPPPKKKTKTL